MARYISQNGSIHSSDGAFLWCLLFGALYFVYKNIWTHAVIYVAAAVLSSGISWFIYPFFAQKIVDNFYREKGYKEV